VPATRGVSEPSNVVGPVKVEYATIVNEFRNPQPFWTPEGDFDFKLARLSNCEGGYLSIGRTEGTFFTYEVTRLGPRLPSLRVLSARGRRFSLLHFGSYENRVINSRWTRNSTEVSCTKKVFFSGAGEYGYWKPVLFTCKPDAPGPCYFED